MTEILDEAPREACPLVPHVLPIEDARAVSRERVLERFAAFGLGIADRAREPLR